MCMGVSEVSTKEGSLFRRKGLKIYLLFHPLWYICYGWAYINGKWVMHEYLFGWKRGTEWYINKQ